MREQYGVDSMPETAENVAVDFGIARDAQDRFALRSQQRAARAQADGTLAQEIVAVHVPQKKGETVAVDRDEHPRETSLETLAKLKGVVRPDGSVTAGNASGVNDGACALLIGSEEAARRNGLTPRARILGMATAGVAPRIMGIGPAPATQKLLARLGMTLDQFDVIELNEAFASQGIAVLRKLGHRGRRCPRQSERRRHRARSSARRFRRAARHDRHVRTRAPQRPVRAVHDVHRRGTGHRHRDRARLRRGDHGARSRQDRRESGASTIRSVRSSEWTRSEATLRRVLLNLPAHSWRGPLPDLALATRYSFDPAA